jgi:hypothetical protein
MDQAQDQTALERTLDFSTKPMSHAMVQLAEAVQENAIATTPNQILQHDRPIRARSIP